MSVLVTAARTALVLASLLGWVHTVSKRVRPEFSLGIVFSAIGGAMFMAGILNILPHAAWAICVGGALLLAWALYKRESFRALLCPGVVFFLICAAVLPVMLYGCKFLQPDNFTHWGISVQKLLRYDRFPILADDEHYYFQSYPLGSTSFIYCFTYLLGVRAEWLQLYIQNLLTAGMLAALFVYVRRWYTAAAAALLSVCMMASDTVSEPLLMYTLLVDILLPAAALSAMAFCIFYRDRIGRMLWWTVPYTVFLMSVKNSGIFFSYVVLLYALAVMGERRKHLGRWLGSALCPAAALLLWQRHVQLVFPDGLTAKHSMSLENFRLVFGDKSPEDVRLILGMCRDSIFSLSNAALYVLAALVLVYLFRRFVLHSSGRSFRQLAAVCLCSYAAYMAAMTAMYLLTMPMGEAQRLAGSDRYVMTIHIFLLGLIFIDASSAIEQLPPRQGRGPAAALCAVMVAMGLLSLTPNPQYLRGQDTSGTQRQALDDIISQNDLPSGQMYLLLYPSSDYDLGFFPEIFKYLCQPEFFTFQKVDFMTGKDFLLANYDYLIMLEQTDECRAYMEQTFGDPDLRVVRLEHDPA